MENKPNKKNKALLVVMIVLFFISLEFCVLIPNIGFKPENNTYYYDISYTVLTLNITTDENIDTNEVYALVFNPKKDDFEYIKLEYKTSDNSSNSYEFSKVFMSSEDIRDLYVKTKEGRELNLIKESEEDVKSRETGKAVCMAIGAIGMISSFIGVIFIASKKVAKKILPIEAKEVRPVTIEEKEPVKEIQPKETSKENVNTNTNLKRCQYCGSVDKTDSLVCHRCGASFDK